jgi:hypothetical protein
VVGEQPQNLRRLRVGGHLVHWVGIQAERVLVAESVDLLQHPGNLTNPHRLVAEPLRPAVLADRGAARHFDLHRQREDHRVHQYLPELR